MVILTLKSKSNEESEKRATYPIAMKDDIPIEQNRRLINSD